MVLLFRCFGRASKVQRDEPVPSSVMDNLNLGVNVLGEKMCVVIPKDSNFPVKTESKYATTTQDYQTMFPINVYEGESEFTKDNIKIGGFTLDGFPPAPKGIAKLKLSFEFDANGTLKVAAFDTITCKLMEEITITSDQRRAAKILNAKNTLQNYANAVIKTLGDARYKGELKVGDKKKIMKLANKAIEWLKQNETAKIYEYENMQKELEAVWNPIVIKLYDGESPMLNKAKPDPKAAGEPSPLPNEGKPRSCSSAPPKAGSVLDVVD